MSARTLLAAIGLVCCASAAQAQQTTITQYAYDAQGNLTTITDPNSRVTTQYFDYLNRIAKVVQPAATSGGSQPNIVTTLDGRDQVTNVQDPRTLSTAYTIDGLGKLTTVASPDTGSTVNSYDLLGNLKVSTDARGMVSTFSYDALNRVTNIAYTAGTASAFQYDGGSSPIQFDTGHLTLITDESGSTRLQYDGYGRIVKKTQIVTGIATVTGIVQYGYSETGATTGKLVSMTYPSGAILALSYDGAGRIAQIMVTKTTAGNVATSTLLSGIAYNPFGAPKSWTWGNSTTYTRSFDVDGRLAQYPLGSIAANVNALTRTVNYDPASRALSFTHRDSTGSGTSPGALAANVSFGYDNLDRLTTYTPSGTSQAYGYDLSGNRTSTTIGSSAYTDAIAATSNQMSSTTGPAPSKSNLYDAAGNLKSDGTVTYTYSARGRMATSVTAGVTTSYLYNGLGQRVYKSATTIPTGANVYVYDEAGHLIGEYDVNGNVLRETVFLGDTPIAVLTPN